MHRLFTFAAATLLLLILPAASAAKESKEEKAKKPRIAILDFPPASGGWSCAGWNQSEHRMSNVLRDLFTSEIGDASSGKVRVIERERLKDVQSELSFEQSGEVDGATAQKIGKLLGVRYMLSGKITRFACKKSEAASGWGIGALVGKVTGSSTAGAVAGSVNTAKMKFTGRIDARLIDTQTGEILGTFKDEEETADTSVKIAGGGSTVDYDEELVNKVYEPIVQRLAPKMVKKIVAVNQEVLAEEDEDDTPVAKRKKAADDDDDAPVAKGKKAADDGAPAPGKKGTAATDVSPDVYSNRFDFVPGENVLTYDDFSDTPAGDYPSRFKMGNGGGAVEVVEIEGKTWLKGLADDGRFRGAGNYLRTDMAKGLPSKLTIEFDMPRTAVLTVSPSDPKANPWQDPHIDITPTQVTAASLNVSSVDQPIKNPGTKYLRHVSIALSGTSVKVYVDGERVLINPDFFKGVFVIRTIGISFPQSEKPRQDLMFTNFKLAEGGRDYAKDLVAGRIVTHGITFDTASDVLKPESGPTLRNILKLLQDNSDVRFEIQGHTDNQGGAKINGPLSERRAAAVKAWLVKQGIEETRLTTKGLGDTKPIAANDSLEGRADNRRVEFVKRTP